MYALHTPSYVTPPKTGPASGWGCGRGHAKPAAAAVLASPATRRGAMQAPHGYSKLEELLLQSGARGVAMVATKRRHDVQLPPSPPPIRAAEFHSLEHQQKSGLLLFDLIKEKA